jgi:AraC family transcriptional regulator
MAHSLTHAALDRLESSLDLAESPRGFGLLGQVTAPQDFCGCIFVGLFSTPIPQSRPVACTVMSQPGPYAITPVPEGYFYLFTAGLPWSSDPKAYFLCESMLRGGGQPIWVHKGVVRGSTDLLLRPPVPLDPPILLTFPLLLAKRTGEEHNTFAHPA